MNPESDGPAKLAETRRIPFLVILARFLVILPPFLVILAPFLLILARFLVILVLFLVILAITAFMSVCLFVGYLNNLLQAVEEVYQHISAHNRPLEANFRYFSNGLDISTLPSYPSTFLGYPSNNSFQRNKRNLHLAGHELINSKVKYKRENTEADSNLMMNSTRRENRQSTVEKGMKALDEGNNRENHKVFTKADTNIHKLISFFAWFSVLLTSMLPVKVIIDYIALKADSNEDKSLQTENNTISMDHLQLILTMNTLNKPDSVCIFLLIFLLDSGDPTLQKPIIFPSEPDSYPDWFFTIFSFLPLATQYIVQKGKSVFQTTCSSISDQSETVWQIPKLGKTLTSLFESLLEGLLHSLCYLNIISEVSAGNHLMVIIEAKLSIDIEKNPGPIHDRWFTAAKNFCENPTSTNIFVLKRYVSIFLRTPTEISKEFLCDEKVEIWITVLNILEEDQSQDKKLSVDIRSIYEVWENALSEKEDSERDDCCQCKCEFHRTSPGSPNMVEPMSHQAITDQVADMSTPPTALPIQPAMPFQQALHFQPALPIQQALPSQAALVIQPASPIQPALPFQPALPIQQALTIQPALPVQQALSIQPALASQAALAIQPASPIEPSTPNGVSMNQETIKILNADGELEGFFTYGRFAGAKHGKFVCQTDCEISQKIDLVKNQGISRDSLINHALKWHSIKLSFEKKEALKIIPGEQFKCIKCNKSFSRKQTHKNHMSKYHQGRAELDPTDHTHTPRQITPTLGAGNILRGNSTTVSINEQSTPIVTNSTISPELFLIPVSPAPEQSANVSSPPIQTETVHIPAQFQQNSNNNWMDEFLSNLLSSNSLSSQEINEARMQDA